MKKRTNFLRKMKKKAVDKTHPLWLKAYFKGTVVGLFVVSLIWIGLEFAFTGWHEPSTNDTVVVFLSACVIGYFYAQGAVKKEESKKFLLASAKNEPN